MLFVYARKRELGIQPEDPRDWTWHGERAKVEGSVIKEFVCTVGCVEQKVISGRIVL